MANLPAWLTGFEQWKVFWQFNSDRGADLGSLWLVLDHARPRGHLGHDQPVVLGALRRGLPRGAGPGAARAETPRVAQLALLVVAGFLLVNKVYSPQYVLWLLPLAVLARPRWRDLLIWQAGELIYFAAVWIYLGGWLDGSVGGGAPVYDLAIWVRVAAELYLVASWCATSCGPSTTRCDAPVRPTARWSELDDPASDVDPVEVGGGVAHPARRSRRRPRARRRRAGRNSIEACMCGGSAKRRCLPPTVYGERTNPAASSPPRAMEAARARRVGSPVGASRPMPWRGAAGDDEDGAGARGRAAAVAEGVAALDRVGVEHGRADRRAPRSPSHRAVPMRGRKLKSGYCCADRGELDLGEVGDPDRAVRCRASRRRPRRSSAARPR